MALAIDERLDAGLTPPQRAALRDALGRLGVAYGLPVRE